MSIESFNKVWTTNMKISKRVKYLEEYVYDMLQEFYKEGYKKKEEVNKLLLSMNNIHSAKAFKEYFTNRNNEKILLAANLIYTFLDTVGSLKLKDEEQENLNEIMKIYAETIDYLISAKVDKMTKAIDINKDIAEVLIIDVPYHKELPQPEFMTNIIFNLNKRFYSLSAQDKIDMNVEDKSLWKTIEFYKKIYDFLFRQLSPYAAINILLEYKDNISSMNENQKTVWNCLTNTALEILEEFDERDIEKLLVIFGNKRKMDKKEGKDKARRTSLIYLDDEKYPKIDRVANKLNETEKFKDLFV